MTDWNEKTAVELLAAGKAAVNRARYVFIAINVVGVALFASQFNATFPWIRNVSARVMRESGSVVDKDKIIERVDDQLFNHLYIVSAPILGIKFSVFDLGVIGSIAMVVLATWLYYSIRRENLAVNGILRFAQSTGVENRTSIAKFLFHGISHYFLFTTAKEERPAGAEQRFAARTVYKILLYLPAWALAVYVPIDFCTVVLARKLGLSPEEALWVKLSFGERVELFFRWGFVLGMAWVCLILIKACVEYDSHTRTDIMHLKSISVSDNSD